MERRNTVAAAALVAVALSVAVPLALLGPSDAVVGQSPAPRAPAKPVVAIYDTASGDVVSLRVVHSETDGTQADVEAKGLEESAWPWALVSDDVRRRSDLVRHPNGRHVRLPEAQAAPPAGRAARLVTAADFPGGTFAPPERKRWRFTGGAFSPVDDAAKLAVAQRSLEAAIVRARVDAVEANTRGYTDLAAELAARAADLEAQLAALR